MLMLNHTALHKLKVHGLAAYPEECCGMLLGTEEGEVRKVCDVLELRNVEGKDRQRRFLVSANDYARAESFAEQQRVKILGIYHSHPDHLAEPSPFDLEQALPWFSYVIVAVEGGIPAVVRSWRLRDDCSRFDEEELVIVETECVHG